MYRYTIQLCPTEPKMEFNKIKPLINYLNSKMPFNFYTPDKLYNYFTGRGASNMVKNLHLLERVRIGKNMEASITI